MKKSMKKQGGISLIEVIAGVLIIGLVIGGALSQFGSASSGQKSNQMLTDLSGLRGAVKGLYNGQGGYGTVNINGVLKAANRIPSTMTVDTSTPPVITHSMNGSVTVSGSGGGTTFSIAMTNIPTDVCTQLLTASSSGWNSIQVNAAAAITAFPISPATAATGCSTTNANTLTFVGS